MIIRKTIKSKIAGLTNIKKEKLNQEYNNFQLALEGQDVNLYSATKQQAERYMWRRLKKAKILREQPLIIRRDCFRIEKQDNKVSKYWAKIPVYKKSIWVAVEIPYAQEYLLDYDIRECKVKKIKGNFFLYITVQKEQNIKNLYSNILAVDLGEKVMATIVCGNKKIISKPQFYCRNIRGIRRHYVWLRKRLGEKKALKTIKKIGHTEKKWINSELHKISKDIVKQANENGACIVLGNLEGIRKSAKGKGKRFNRIISNMPYYKLTQMITYKAEWEGIRVVQINEIGTSCICSRCGLEGKRNYQGLFKCPTCKYEINADYNGAKNILKRYSDYMFEYGAELTQPLISTNKIDRTAVPLGR
jgi:putative transposase